METEATRYRLRALVEAGIALSSELSLDALLQKLAETAAELTGARYAALGVIDPTHTRLERFITTGMDEQTYRAIGELPHGRGILGVLVSDATPLRLHDIAEDPRSVGFPPGHPPMKTFLGVPVLLRNFAYGNLYLTEKEDGSHFTAEDEELVRLLAGQAAVAIENARLYESATRLSRQLESQRDALRRVVDAQELERRRVARELHDETGQALTSILLGLKLVEEAKDETQSDAARAELHDLAVSTLQDVRRLAVELRPKALDDFGLQAALEHVAQTFTEQIGIETDVETSLGDKRLPPDVETALYRLVQEALTNVVKHSRASHVSISLVRKAHSVSAVIEDDGVGFDELTGEGLGLIGMRERVGLLDGRLDVESRSGHGTTVVAEVPL